MYVALLVYVCGTVSMYVALLVYVCGTRLFGTSLIPNSALPEDGVYTETYGSFLMSI